IGIQRDYRLDGKIGVVRKVSGEIIRAKLVVGIESLILQVRRPFLQQWPIGPAEFGITFRFGERGQQDKHIAAFLNRHLAIFGFFAASVNLPIREWIGAEIMRRERKAPAW